MSRDNKDDQLDSESSVGIVANGGCARALRKLDEVIMEGLRHGHFECSVVCDVIKGKKRRLLIKTGVSYQFIIPLEEIENLP